MKRAMIAGFAGTAVISGVLALSSAPAWANGGDAIGLDVHNAQLTLTSTDGLNCTWFIDSTVTVVNLTSTTLDISDVAARVTWSNGGASALLAGTIVNNGGLQAGDTVNAGSTQAYEPVDTTVTIPCAAQFADLAIQVTDQFGAGSGDAPFIDGGQPLPVAAIGGAGVAGLFGIWLIWLQRRRRHVVAPTEVVAP